MQRPGSIRAALALMLLIGSAVMAAAAAPSAPVRWTGKPPPPPAVRPRAHIDWAEKPSPEDLARYYPKGAARKALAGRATIACQVTDDGRLKACTVVSESPPGEGFGEAALKASASFRMRVDPGTSPLARKVRIPITFRLDGPSGGPGPKEMAGLTLAARIAALAAFAAAGLAMLAWAVAATATRRGREEPAGGDIVGVIGMRPSPAGSALSGAAHLYPRTYRADGFLGGGRGWFACVVIFFTTLGAALVGALVVVSGDHLDALAVTLIAVFAALGLHAAWRLIVLFRSFVILTEDAIEHQGLFGWRRIPRADIEAYRMRARGALPELLLLKVRDEPRPVSIPILWHQDAVFEHWFNGLEARHHL